MTSSDAWLTPDIREALARLEEAEVALDHTILEAKQLEQRVQKTQLSEEDIRQIEEHARSGAAPKELRELQRRVDAGELSWNDIASGRHLDDPRVQGALSSGVEGMRQAYTLIQEGQDLDEIVEEGRPPSRFASDAPDEGPDHDGPDDDDGPVFRSVY
jgi:hypothetical protein